MAAIVADLGGSAKMNEELAGLKKPLDFSAVQELTAREIGLGQPALGDLEGFYTGRVEGEERCLHLTFDDEETLLVDIFDSIAAAMPYGKGDLIVSPLYINLRTGEAWYDESDFPLPTHNPGLELAGELNQAVTGLQHLLKNLASWQSKSAWIGLSCWSNSASTTMPPPARIPLRPGILT